MSFYILLGKFCILKQVILLQYISKPREEGKKCNIVKMKFEQITQNDEAEIYIYIYKRKCLV